MSFDKELALALEIVQVSCRITTSVAEHTLTDQTQIKNDKSPVTVGDYSVQAYVNKKIHENFPEDKIVAEEDTKTIPDDIFAKVCKHVQMHSDMKDEEVRKCIDLGNGAGGKGRYWVLDPIDGTLGFLRREQYAVCLAFMIDGDIKVGVLGCPNFEGGLIVAAQKGCGAKMFTVNDIKNGKNIHVSTTPKTSDMCFCESVEVSHTDQSRSKTITERLQVTKPPVRMDSQCKYMAIASGKADVYLRLPRNLSYQEKIWDHAAGYLIVKEAGGKVTDIYGNDLDFSLGRTLCHNHGIVASNGTLHDETVNVVKDVLSDLK
ncbi:SAL1 phosphatase, putative [Entamoeba dispar SAW760]|uniref:3'(2'),5'-bisphosphate nucleotidase n=1 Tax=Entamoeba dispar (strain ATCC PRA-260 / SAW760) TaxID=370354 RepID=B0EFK5_ENTDS|nr:SAL1 phosphatase, putative [Entamoeba dispar SAW760]EDR26687.1 SAL1 phosphatase, putative [Entamoeba dispar SAW760]|eukprot:EDR26687.1 SAL1 phosphatase, putative [Entamoeba dispar SAW760]